jgi:hypothetical protein
LLICFGASDVSHVTFRIYANSDMSVREVMGRAGERQTSPCRQTVCADGEMILGDQTLRFAGMAETGRETATMSTKIGAKMAKCMTDGEVRW